MASGSCHQFLPRQRDAASAQEPVIVHGVEIHPRVVSLADNFGHDLARVAEDVLDHEASWPGKYNDSVVHLRGDIAVVTTLDTGEVIALATRKRALEQRREPRYGAIPRARGGGCGRRFPADTNDLLARMDKAGFIIERDQNHYVYRHPAHPGVQRTMPRSPSDWRSIPNTVLDIRRCFGIDVRDIE